MSRVYNFSAGPAVLPEEVLKEVAEEMMDYRGCGMSVMEMSHRSKMFDDIIQETEKDLRDLMHIPDNYKVLFLQGGASQQFAMIPMNLMKNRVADYIVTGQWAKKHGRKHRNTEKQIRLHLLRIRHSPIFRIVPICQSVKMLIMYISVRIIRSMEQSTKSFQIQKASFWYPMYPPVFCQNQSM